MAISPVLLKGIAAAGAASTVVVGGTYLYMNKDSIKFTTAVEKNLDELAFSDDKTHLTWSAEVVDKYSLNVKGTKDSKTWTCKIKGAKTNGTDSDTIGIKAQVEEALGIENGGTIKTDKKEDFKKFIENCKRHRETALSNDSASFKITLDLGELESVSGTYKFKDEDFKKLYEQEEHWTQNFKEKKLNINCTGSNCSIVSEKQLEGFEAASGKTISITKSTQESPDEFTDGIKYVISQTQNKDGNYKIEKDENKTNDFKLTKVEDLTLEKLCEKVNLLCTNGETPTCTIKTDGNSKWNAVFYESDDKHSKGSTITGITKATVATGQEASKYTGGYKFTFTGTANFNPALTGSSPLTIDANSNYSIKYIPSLKTYAFFKVTS